MNAYNLEQQIMECWRITDDISMLTEETLEGDLTKDKIINVLTGLEQLYAIRFNKLFRTYEQLLAERKLIP
jgi:hypothetical protein